MDYVTAVDSCGELTEELKADGRFFTAPLAIEIDGHHIIDDETFDQADFLRRVAKSHAGPKSACPSPQTFLDIFRKSEGRAYAVTLSAELSGSYTSAQLARSMYLEENPDAKVHVFNSCSASIGETLIAMEIKACEEKGMGFAQVVSHVEHYISTQVTWFVLESLETLRKAGRLSNLKALVATALKIKPVMVSTPEGRIAKLEQARGINKALLRMVDNIVETVKKPEERILAISHCNCPDRGQMVLDAIRERITVKDAILLDTRGISSMYANDGSVIVVI